MGSPSTPACLLHSITAAIVCRAWPALLGDSWDGILPHQMFQDGMDAWQNIDQAGMVGERRGGAGRGLATGLHGVRWEARTSHRQNHAYRPPMWGGGGARLDAGTHPPLQIIPTPKKIPLPCLSLSHPYLHWQSMLVNLAKAQSLGWGHVCQCPLCSPPTFQFPQRSLQSRLTITLIYLLYVANLYPATLLSILFFKAKKNNCLLEDLVGT